MGVKTYFIEFSRKQGKHSVLKKNYVFILSFYLNNIISIIKSQGKYFENPAFSAEGKLKLSD